MEENSVVVDETVNSSEVVTEKTFTRDEVNKIVATEKNRAIEEIKRQLEEEKSEAEKLAGMKEKERLEYELSKRDKEIELLKRKETARQLQAEALKIATTKETEFNPVLLGLIDFENETAETLNEKTKLIKEVFDKAVESAINEYSKEEKPIQNNSVDTETKGYIPNIF